MYFRELTLKAVLPENISTEIMFEVAAARADRIELLRINILNEETTDDSYKKLLSTLKKLLKSMKADGRIQFFANEESFKAQSTEAVFLKNKYPDLFDLSKKHSGEKGFVYIKI